MKIKLAAEEVKKERQLFKETWKSMPHSLYFILKACSNSMGRAPTRTHGWAPQVKGKGTNGATCTGPATCQDLFQSTALRLWFCFDEWSRHHTALRTRRFQVISTGNSSKWGSGHGGLHHNPGDTGIEIKKPWLEGEAKEGRMGGREGGWFEGWKKKLNQVLPLKTFSRNEEKLKCWNACLEPEVFGFNP